VRHRARARHALPSAPFRSGVQLAWALDREGRKVRAARLVAPDRRGRAPFTCLGCGQELIPHLGRVRTPHFAHRPDSSCPLTAPETALHLDAKERLLALCQDAFAGRGRVRALARCPACRRVTPIDLAEVGDAAEAEASVGPLRADVLVRSRGRPALAFEVRVTHAVQPDKEAALSHAGVPAVEVDAREDWEREAEGGSDIACVRSFGFEPCPACATRARADLERGGGEEAAEIADLEDYRARGLLGGPAPGRPGASGPGAPISEPELADLRTRFRCPDCGRGDLEIGVRIARHPCRSPAGTAGWGGQARPVAWRGYDGSLVTLRWWEKGGRQTSSPGASRGRKGH
jgi:hypothetical protein